MSLLDVVAIQRGCVFDGSGVRTTVFLRGCSFACPWCCNPESLQPHGTLFIDDSKCLIIQKNNSLLCKDCVRKGGKQPLVDCPFRVAEPISRFMTIDELMDEILHDKELFQSSGGGVTFSGGEPLMSIENLFPILRKLKANNIHIAIETTLYTKSSSLFLEIFPLIDEWIIDLKLQRENFKPDYQRVIYENLICLRRNVANIQFRLVYIEGMNPDEIFRVLNQLNIFNIELLQCHTLAESKYKKLNIPFVKYQSSVHYFLQFAETLSNLGISVKKMIS